MLPKNLCLLLVINLFNLNIFAQTNKVDSLQNIINSKTSDPEKIKAFKALTYFYSAKNFDKAIFLANEGIELSGKSKDLSATATFKSLIGVSFYLKGNFDSAAHYYSLALDLMAKANDPGGRASVLNYTGRLYRKLKEYDRSLLMYNEAFEIYKKLNDEDGMATIYNESGVVYEYKAEYNEAISRYTNSLKIREKQNDLLGKSYSLSFIGAIYSMQKKYEAAEKYLQESLEIRKNLNDSFSIALSLQDLAEMYSEKRDFAKSIAYYNSSSAIASSLKYTQLQAENYSKLSVIAEQQGNPSQSLALYKKYSALKDSLFSVEKINQIEELNTKYQTEKKEQQLKIQEAALQKKNFLLTGSSIVFLLLTLTAINIYRKRQAQNKLHLQQEVTRQQDLATKAIIEAEEHERRRIAADLHDGVGQMMSVARMNLSVFEDELVLVNEHQKKSFEKLINLVDESCKEIRNVSHQMMPNALLKSGLASAIKEFTDKIDNRIIKVSIHAGGFNEPIDKNTETVLYRVIQECVNNVLKHSGATLLDISLIKDNDGIAATIEDNGKGFDSTDKNKYDGIGLKNIISRITYLKGTIDFDSSPGKGTLIAIHVPVK